MMTNEDQIERIRLFWDHHAVKEWIGPYEDEPERVLEPLLQWSLARTHHPKAVAVLQDWHLPERVNGRVVPQDYDTWINACFDGRYDRTFSPLFRRSWTTQEGKLVWDNNWSEREIVRGNLLVMNAVPGLRTAKCASSTSDLDPELHLAAMVIYWLPFLKTVKLEHVFLCGDWAIGFLEAPREAMATVGVNDVQRLHHPGMEFYGGNRWTGNDPLS
jgi:hypothetical protein